MGNVFDLNDGVNDGRDEGEEADRAEGVGLDALAVSRLRHEDHRGAVVVRRTGFSAGGVETNYWVLLPLHQGFHTRGLRTSGKMTF